MNSFFDLRVIIVYKLFEWLSLVRMFGELVENKGILGLFYFYFLWVVLGILFDGKLVFIKLCCYCYLMYSVLVFGEWLKSGVWVMDSERG